MRLEKYFSKPEKISTYKEKTFKGTEEEYIKAMLESSTVYVNHLEHTIREERIWELFGLCGEIRRVIMGVNRNKLTSCGFCFVEYYKPEDAERSIQLLNMFRFEGRLINVDKDYGFVEGRQYGRGVFGGKMKDDKTKRRLLVHDNELRYKRLRE